MHFFWWNYAYYPPLVGQLVWLRLKLLLWELKNCVRASCPCWLIDHLKLEQNFMADLLHRAISGYNESLCWPWACVPGYQVCRYNNPKCIQLLGTWSKRWRFNWQGSQLLKIVLRPDKTYASGSFPSPTGSQVWLTHNPPPPLWHTWDPNPQKNQKMLPQMAPIFLEAPNGWLRCRRRFFFQKNRPDNFGSH